MSPTIARTSDSAAKAITIRNVAIAAMRVFAASLDPDYHGGTGDTSAIDIIANFNDDPRRIVAQDEGQGHAVVAAILSYLYVQRAIDRDGVHLDDDLSGVRGRRRHVLPPEDLGASKFSHEYGFHMRPFT